MSQSYASIQKILNEVDMDNYPNLNISILRNITVEPIEPYLRYFAYQSDLKAQIRFGEYDTIFQDAIGGNPDILNYSTDCVIIFLKLEIISSLLVRQFPLMKPEQISSEVTRIHDYVIAVLGGIRKQTNAMILWAGFELPSYPALGVIDSQTTLGQSATIVRLNDLIKQDLSNEKNAYFLDLNLSIYRLGIKKYFDNRYWHIGRAPYTREALQDIASESFKFIRALKGKNKKCLILDCDNTLWGGIIGEDGLSGIKLSSSSHPGSSFYEFQQEVVNLYHRGVIIALCSKNNEEDVWEVFCNHPDMVLKKDFISSSQINWDDKASNIRRIATDLNIGLDSLVFMDDSEFEIDLVRKVLPAVTTIHLPSKQSVEYKDIISSCGLFDTIIISDEDRARGAMYLAEQDRNQTKSQYNSIEQYHHSLGMIAEVHFADSFSIPRIAQLTQKTNQFNLTTRRYSDADISEYSARDDADVIYVKLRDRFGDYGIAGVCILTYVERQAIINTFLLSCRVLGRHVEDIFLVQALRLSQLKGCTIAKGEYIPTQKNTQVANFYHNFGFDQNHQLSFLLDLSSIIDTGEKFFAGQVLSYLSSQ